MPSGDKPFKVGDRVIVIPGSGVSLRYATESHVSRVRKDGKFSVEDSGDDFLFSRTGHAMQFSARTRDQFAHVEHWRQELAAKVSHAKLVGRVANKMARLSHKEAELLSTEQLCRIEALLDKITEERAKEGKDA